ncbi:hypothetical protein C1752_02004 [Acaryochloris thomasi RCC1774]|uniref:Uncharacterized protein n=1 Tax=Acaryochloris thomasi RCC1774 TaxID=1764569 RepID=A0A2W1JSK3_9CYAN|nr:hypothetical protein [Acaryochloris thomasi]PZD73622.1 hypothetical protein C1752_02004 [Acaryochloris thomasi RCC1774]
MGRLTGRLQSRQSDRGPTAEKLLQRLDPKIFDSLTSEQTTAITTLLTQITLGSSAQRPKIIDIRFVVDLIITRFYLVLLVGKDRRHRERSRQSTGLKKIGNAIAAGLLLVAANLVISAVILLSAYLIKSALGIDLLPGHFARYLQQL